MEGSAALLESVPTEFDYFESKVIQAAIVSEYDRDFLPQGTFQPGAPIEFLVRSSSNSYLDLNNSKLELDCKVTNADGTDIAADVNVGLTNLTLHSLFSNIEMDLCSKRITDANNLYAYRSFMETILTYDDDVSKTRLICEGWERDTEGHFDDFSMADAGTNTGFKSRSRKIARSRTFTLIGRPHLDLFHQDKDIPPGCDLLLRLIPAPNAFVVKKPANVNEGFRIVIRSARLWLRTKEVSPSLLLAHEHMLQKQNIRIPFTKVAMKHVTIPVGVTSMEFDNLYTGVLPERLLMGFVADTRMNGTSAENPFTFSNMGLSHVALKVNGEQIPRIAYEPNFTTGDYLREYLGLLEGLALDSGTESIAVTPTQWAETYPLFLFRLTPSGLPSVPKTGSARLELKFRAATNVIMNGVLFAEFPSMLEIDRYRNLLIA